GDGQSRESAHRWPISGQSPGGAHCGDRHPHRPAATPKVQACGEIRAQSQEEALSAIAGQYARSDRRAGIETRLALSGGFREAIHSY
ncbi:MAG: hypothetical protein RL145_1487, partial [Pseudomonadota bacterium]